MKPIAVYADIVDLDPAPGVVLLTDAGFDVRVLNSDRASVIAEAGAEAVALLISYAEVSEPLIHAMPQLKIIATQSAGVDTVDLAAASRRGIWVTNVEGTATQDVASHAFAMAMIRGLPFLDRDVRAGIWDATRHELRRPSELTVGVLGMGKIGQRFCELMRPVAGRVVGFDPHQSAPTGVETMEMDEVLRVSDLVSLHLPLTDQTRRLLDRERMRTMRPNAIVVNVSRGALIDQPALLELLDEGRLYGAALDVLETEPPTAHDPVRRHARVLLTPHAAYRSPTTEREYVVQQAENVIGWYRDGRPKTAVIGPSTTAGLSNFEN